MNTTESNWNQLILAKLPDDTITGRDIIEYLQKQLLKTNVINELISEKLLQHEFIKRNILASDAEIETLINKFRLEKHLLTGAATQKWLDQSHLSSSDIWDIFDKKVKTEKLKEILFDDETIEETFALRKSLLCRVSFYQIVVKNEKKAAELAALIKLGNSFFELARKYSEDKNSSGACGYEGIKFVSEFEPEIQYKIAGASDNEFIGPLRCLGQHFLIYIDKIIPAVLDQQMRSNIREQLFLKWCEEQVGATPFELMDPDADGNEGADRD